MQPMQQVPATHLPPVQVVPSGIGVQVPLGAHVLQAPHDEVPQQTLFTQKLLAHSGPVEHEAPSPPSAPHIPIGVHVVPPTQSPAPPQLTRQAAPPSHMYGLHR